jgi:2-oxoglutarate ferredoxin oxidoreductase subunit alpha
VLKDPHSNVFTIGIGGAAGDGVRESGQSLGQLLCELGYEVYISNTYPSLIRGGHNFTRISFSKEKVWCDHNELDVLIALNEETVKLHRDELKIVRKDNKTTETFGGVIFADAFELEDVEKLGTNAVTIPMSASSKELNAPAITRNSVALGATCYLLDLDYKIMQKILADVFKNKMPEINIKLADIGYEHMRNSRGFSSRPRLEEKPRGLASSKKLLDGNTSIGLGLISAGLDSYIAYPMTPVTGLLHFLAEASPRGLASRRSLEVLEASPQVIQPENELSVINMALGMSYAGKRVAIGSATGGFMLMQESFSMAGMAELPLVVIVGQRQAPATGVPTFSSQTDLHSAIHAGHGEFPRIVIAPGDHEEAFYSGISALNLAWKYQIPVIVLMDKNLCEHSATVTIDTSMRIVERGKTVSSLSNFEIEGREYDRYAITSDGISPMVFPGIPNAVVKITSYEHDEHGITADEAGPVKAMIDKRFKKEETIHKELDEMETIKVYGHEKSRDVIVFWGSTKSPVLEAAKYLKSPVKFLQILCVEPFPKIKVSKILRDAKRIINIECNHNAQMAGLIKEKTGISVTNNILKYDSRPFDPIKLADEINSLRNDP